MTAGVLSRPKVPYFTSSASRMTRAGERTRIASFINWGTVVSDQNCGSVSKGVRSAAPRACLPLPVQTSVSFVIRVDRSCRSWCARLSLITCMKRLTCTWSQSRVKAGSCAIAWESTANSASRQGGIDNKGITFEECREEPFPFTCSNGGHGTWKFCRVIKRNRRVRLGPSITRLSEPTRRLVSYCASILVRSSRTWVGIRCQSGRSGATGRVCTPGT